MISHHVYSQLAILGCLWLCIMVHGGWPSRSTRAHLRPAAPVPLTCKRTRSTEPTPFEGLTQRPHCAACAHDANHPQGPPPLRPDPMPPTNRRPRIIDTSLHFCPHTGCAYHGWLGLGNLRANGHPSGGPWRQCPWRSYDGSFLETHGTLFHGKRLSEELIVRVLACLAEGLGIRATARGFEVDPKTVLQWLVAAAEQGKAFSAYVLRNVHVKQLQLDALYAVLLARRERRRCTGHQRPSGPECLAALPTPRPHGAGHALARRGLPGAPPPWRGGVLRHDAPPLVGFRCHAGPPHGWGPGWALALAGLGTGRQACHQPGPAPRETDTDGPAAPAQREARAPQLCPPQALLGRHAVVQSLSAPWATHA